jgi:hypothetical protein
VITLAVRVAVFTEIGKLNVASLGALEPQDKTFRE